MHVAIFICLYQAICSYSLSLKKENMSGCNMASKGENILLRDHRIPVPEPKADSGWLTCRPQFYVLAEIPLLSTFCNLVTESLICTGYIANKPEIIFLCLPTARCGHVTKFQPKEFMIKWTTSGLYLLKKELTSSSLLLQDRPQTVLVSNVWQCQWSKHTRTVVVNYSLISESPGEL